MSRLFSGSNDEVRYPVQAGSNFTGAASLAVWMDFAGSNGTWQSLIVHHKSDGTYAIGIERSGGTNVNAMAIAINNSQPTKYATTTMLAADGWMLIGMSRAAGSSAWRAHIYKAGSWTHDAGGALDNFNNAPSHSGGSIRLGEFKDTDDFNGYIAADAGWAADIGDAGFVALTADMATWVGHATPPAYCHQHTQASASDDILDLMGNGHDATGTISGVTDAVGIAGTTMDASAPSGWVPFGSTPIVIPTLVMAPPIPA